MKPTDFLEVILSSFAGTFLLDILENLKKGEFEKIKTRRKKGEEPAGKMIPFQRAAHATLLQYARNISALISSLEALDDPMGVFRQKIKELEELNDKFEDALDFMRKHIKKGAGNPEKKIAMRFGHKIVLLAEKRNDAEEKSPAYQWARASNFLSKVNIETGEIRLG